MKKWTVKDLALIALMAVLIAVCSWISIPAAVPFTLQTLGVFLALRLLGGAKGTVSVLIYILLGAVGVPVFAGFSGGVGVLFGPTGGYILGFLAAGLVYLLLEKVPKHGKVMDILRMVAGLLVCYALGTAWFYYTYGVQNAMGIGAVLMACVVPFILPDAVKIVLAQLLAERLQKVLKLK
ncbi:MAG: biotin transporter BioY [Acutalibacteraceae bacterium]